MPFAEQEHTMKASERVVSEALFTIETKEQAEQVVFGKVSFKVNRPFYGIVWSEPDAEGNRTIAQNVKQVKKELFKVAGESGKQDVIDAHMKELTFDFEGVWVDELGHNGMSMSTVYKLYYNNELFQKTEEELAAMGKKITVSVKELLRSTRTAKPKLTPMEQLAKDVASGKTSVSELESMLAALKKDTSHADAGIAKDKAAADAIK